MNTVSYLLCYPWRTLTALGDVYHVSAHHHLDKKDVAQELSAAIHAQLVQTLTGLSPDALAALRALMQAENLAMPRSDFITRFGRLHPYRPWDPDAPPAPWPDPSSPAATLVHHGLAYPLNRGSTERPFNVILLPQDLCDAVTIHLDMSISLPPPTPPAGSQPADLQLADLVTDTFTFLSFLNRQDHSVRHGRWLPPQALQTLNQVLTPPDDLGPGRSELQAARIPFIHYLAERVGLVGLIGGYLKPTLSAHSWLAATRPQRLRALWDAWREPCDENRALWRRYRLPALQEDDDPSARFHTLLEPLSACPPGPLGSVTGLLETLIERAPDLLRPQAPYATWAALDPGARAHFEERARTVLLALLTGPLTWFGVLEWPNGPTGEPANRRASFSPVSLSPLGAALFGRDDGDWPADPPPELLRIAPLLALDESKEPAIRIDVPAGLPLPDHFALQAITPPDTAAPGRHALTRPRLLGALQRGHTVAGVINLLERASGEPLSAPVLGALYHWEDDFNRVTIRQALLLQTQDAASLSDLTAQRRIRETLGKTLNTRTVEVRADRLDALRRRLARRGIIPNLDLPQPSPTHSASPSEREMEDAERAALAAALRIYAHLADELGLVTRPAHALAHRWSQSLPLHLRDGVDRTVERTLDALHRAAPLEMEDRLPEATGPLLGSLETAIQEQATVEIDYYTAGRAHRTRRSVDPLRLEWRGNVVYLIAYCHLRRDQRVFRVDRIARVKT